MSAMPVVWCTDPNSSSKKPTAFALHGIQLQGNISEQHVLAVRELINAAAEGRLLLPADGGIVLLNCGVGVGSVIIQESNNTKNCSNKENERSRAVNDIVQQKMLDNIENNVKVTRIEKKLPELDYLRNEILYEFLCCARCTNEGIKRCSRSYQNLKTVAKYLNNKVSSARCNRRLSNVKRPVNSRRKNTVSFKSEKRPLRRIQSGIMASKIPIYATVNKQQKQKKNRHQQNNQINQAERNDLILHTASDATESNELLVTVAGTGRKTSFDSTCTVSSMDSGFIEMQNKLEIAKKAANSLRKANAIEITIDSSAEINMVDRGQIMPNAWNRLTIPSQSRNRRKSYEEFKSLFCDHEKFSPSTEENKLDTKSSIKSRRKSYEEFKSAIKVSCDINSTNNCKPIDNELETNNTLRSALTSQENSGTLLSKMKRKNSKRISTRKTKFDSKTVNQKIDEDAKSHSDVQNLTIYDILRKSNDNFKNSGKTESKYVKNLELFKSHCSKNDIKDFDNLLSCGTIYDIIQRRSDFYAKNFKRYDKYMTYGTLYEILHRKSDDDDSFERHKTLSEKASAKRINYAHIDFKSHSEIEKSEKDIATTDMSIQHLNSTSTSMSVSSMKQGSNGDNNQLSISSFGSQQLSTIYDILQTKKNETALNPTALFKGRNRFMVRRITEEDLIESRKENVETKSIEIIEECENKIEIAQQTIEQPFKKQNRIRRFSNILSYTSKVTNESDKTAILKCSNLEAEKKTNVHLEAKIDELYSRLNKITRQHESQQLATKIETESKINKICMTNQLDMMTSLEETENRSTKQKSYRKISVPTHQPMKVLPKKSTRRLSEFTRGEFLNEKS